MSLLAAVDLNWLLQFIVTVFILALGLLHLVKNTASRYFLADENDSDGISGWSSPRATTAAAKNIDSCMMKTTMKTTELIPEEAACAVCGNLTKKKCSGCKMVMYWYANYFEDQLLILCYFMERLIDDICVR